MRQLDIDPARGSTTQIDPSVAPNGTLARVENLRVDKDGRLVLRKGYTSLGTSVEGTSGPATLVPHDLHSLGQGLVALGNHSAANQVGIRAAYRYVNSPRGAWRTEQQQDTLDTTSRLHNIGAADSVKVILTELESLASDTQYCDVAADSTGRYVALATSCEDALTPEGSRFSVFDTELRQLVFHQSRISLTQPLARNVRVLAIGTVFYLFEQVTTNIQVRTWDSATSAQAFTAATTIATGVSAIPARYDVSAFIGSTDYLLAFPTATGYTWRRFNSAHVQQTTTSVVSLADAPVGICGASGETVSVVNIRAVDGVELRTFNTAGALTVGPTNIDSIGATVYDWCSVSRFDASNVICTAHASAFSADNVIVRTATTAAHALTNLDRQTGTKPVSKVAMVNGAPFMWATMGASSARPFGLSYLGSTGTAAGPVLSALALDGAAPTAYAALTAPQKSALVAGSRARYYVGVISQDSRDKTYRANLIECKIHSGERRQGVESGGVLYLAGGTTCQFDGRTIAELGFETVPAIFSLTGTALGSLTALGTYVYQIVYRAVASNGATSQSSPSAPVTITLAGVETAVTVAFYTPYSIRLNRGMRGQGVETYVDIYRTEAGGSIPRLVRTVRTIPPTIWGAVDSISDGAADSVQQTGAVLYTQGADGSISGRLPLGLAAPSQMIAEADGRLILGGLEREESLQFSIEARPGEAAGFVNDDLFFLRNPEKVMGVATVTGGRRCIFGPNNIREVVGQGPNAAGVGDISEPVETEARVGCADWRSIVKTEHGVFFQASALGRPRIYLLPEAGGALDASQGVTDLLAQFPVITSATRHDEEQLVTFSIQTADGTDGRLLHLDLRTSGMGRNGWQGTWIVDRVATLEAVQFPRILEERSQVFPAVNVTQTLTIELPRARRVGDRVLIIAYGPLLGIGTLAIGAVSGMATTAVGTTAVGLLAQLVDLRQTSATDFQTTVSVTYTQVVAPGVASATIVFRLLHIRGVDPATAPGATTVINAGTTTWTIPALVPAWGSAKTLWIASAAANQSFSDIANPVIRGIPAGFSSASRRASRVGSNSFNNLDSVVCSRQFEGSTLSATFTSVVAAVGPGWLVAYRPLTAGGTPVRASTRYQGRLVVCSSTDVLRSDPTAIADPSSAVIVGEWEHADIHPMGPGGAGRHLGVGLMFELLGETSLAAWFSYDGGVTWSGVREFRFGPTYGFQIGTQCKVRWVPARRKIDRVRMRLVIADDTTVSAGATRGIALQRVTHWFEDLAGPARRQVSTTNNVGDRR